ncbi:MAG: ABC transporter permease [Opitutae bacterium]|nr:ABC transporter permease [Opitutae bacterium]
MHTLIQDVRFGVRTLLKNPGFSLVALLTLALALGANTAIFSFVDGVLLKPLPYPDADRIVRVLEAPPGGGRNGISTLNYLDWARDNRSFEFIAARTGGSATLTGSDEPVRLSGAQVTAQFFDVFGAKAALGRTFLPGEDQPGRSHVVVIADSLWRTQFGSDPQILGRKIVLDSEPYEIVGVMPRGTAFDRGYARFWRPLVFKPENMTRNFHWFGAVAKLKPGVTLEQAQADMDTIGKRIAADFPDSNKGWGVGVDLLGEAIVNDDLRRSLYVLLAAVGMVLLIACANLANLSLMRVVGREREIAVRTALGAGRWTLARQFLTESVVLSLGGGAVGVALGYGAMQALKAAAPSYAIPSEVVVTLDWRVALFAFALSLLTGALVGLLPAWQAAKPDLTQSLKQGGGSGTGHGHSRVRGALVVVEVALAFVLLAGAGLLIRSLGKLGEVDPGFNATNVLTFRLPMAETRFASPEALSTYLRTVSARLAALPGVTDLALSTALPMQGWGYGMPYLVADKPTVDRANRRAGYFKMVSPSYHRALQMRLVKGRLLDERDVRGGPPAMVINETMAKREFAGVDPIGKRILVQEIVPGKTQLGDEIPWEIVGVVADEKVGGLDDIEGAPGMYVSNAQSPSYGAGVLLRGAGDTSLLREAVRKAIREVDRDQVVADMKTLEEIKEESLGNNRFRALLLGSFAGVSLLLSAVGIYGVISYSVTQRTREIGIRAALGASERDVVRLVLRHGMGLTTLGLLVGIGGALGLTQLLGTLVFGIGSRDPLTLGSVAVALGAVALAACLIPARRATRVSPVIALRSD